MHYIVAITQMFTGASLLYVYILFSQLLKTCTVECQYTAINGIHGIEPHYKWYHLILVYLYQILCITHIRSPWSTSVIMIFAVYQYALYWHFTVYSQFLVAFVDVQMMYFFSCKYISVWFFTAATYYCSTL